MSQLRIIGGQWRGRKLTFPEIEGLRPTGDRIRETLFNWLAPDIQGARVLDLFAGSGALGLEALSRGAEMAVLIEKHPQAAAILLSHLKTLSAENAKVHSMDAVQFLQQGNSGDPYNIVFIDPPFNADLWQPIVELLNKPQWLATNAWIYVETPKESNWQAPEGWYPHRDKMAGQVRYRLFIANEMTDS
jgi:16S rRNA (guanine966-N2)-methyltransferase